MYLNLIIEFIKLSNCRLTITLDVFKCLQIYIISNQKFD